jgi:hypothetical protein
MTTVDLFQLILPRPVTETMVYIHAHHKLFPHIQSDWNYYAQRIYCIHVAACDRLGSVRRRQADLPGSALLTYVSAFNIAFIVADQSPWLQRKPMERSRRSRERVHEYSSRWVERFSLGGQTRELPPD